MKTAFNRRTVILAAALGAGTTLLQACGGGDDEPQRNIVELAKNTPELSILVEAVVAADLAATLSTGTLTVFAPTNAAFAALLTELGVSKEALLANKPLLTAVLTYHVLGSTVARADVPLGKAITPVSGGFFKIESNNGLKITDGRNRVSTITATDIQASNGVVHLVDRVLLPADKDIVATASALPDFSILVEAVVAAGLASTLQGTGPFTVFAPTNAAFAALLTELGVSKADLLANTAADQGADLPRGSGARAQGRGARQHRHHHRAGPEFHRELQPGHHRPEHAHQQHRGHRRIYQQWRDSRGGRGDPAQVSRVTLTPIAKEPGMPGSFFWVETAQLRDAGCGLCAYAVSATFACR